MSVPEQVPYKEYRATGSNNTFEITFHLPDPKDLVVMVNKEIPLVGAFSIVGDSVVFNTPPNEGDLVELTRDTQLDRETEYKSYDNSFRPETINFDLDKIWLVLQEQNLVDAKILARLKAEIEWRRTHDFNYDELAQVREKQLFDALKGYTDTLLASTNPGVFQGVIAGVVFAQDGKSIQTHIEEILNNLELNRSYIDEQVGLMAPQATTYNKVEVDTKINAEATRAQVAEQVLQDQVNAVGVGNKAYLTYAEMDADKANNPINSKLEVTNDPDPAKNGTYQWNGTTLTKSAHDPLAQAKLDATTKANAAEASAKSYTDEKTKNIKTGFSANNNLSPVLIDENGYPILQVRKNDGALFFTDPNIKIIKSFGTTGVQFIDENGYPILFGSEGTVTELIQQVEATLATVTPSITQLLNDEALFTLQKWMYALSQVRRKKRSHAYATVFGDSLTQGSGRLSVWDEVYLNAGLKYGFGGLGFAPINPDIIPSFGQDLNNTVLKYSYSTSDFSKAYYAAGTLPDGYKAWAVPAGMYTSATSTGDLSISVDDAYKSLDAYKFDTIHIFAFSTGADSVIQVTTDNETKTVTLAATTTSAPVVTKITVNNVSMNAWKIKKISGSGVLHLAGQQIINSKGGIVVNRMAIGGMRLEHHSQMFEANRQYYLTELGADIGVINLGQNDGSASQSTFSANYETLIKSFRALQTYGSLYCVAWFSEGAYGWLDKIQALATTYNIPIINTRQVIPSGSWARVRGLLLTDNNLDPHLTEEGASYVAPFFTKKLGLDI